MTRIELNTFINASIEKCFDLSLDVNIHTTSTANTKEFVLEGRKEGIFEQGETVTWRAKHFGIWQNLTVKITEVKRPDYFIDVMIKGAFKSMKHVHSFREDKGGVIMNDVFEYETPYGIFGILFDKVILKNYMRRFLQQRNEVIKAEAEKF